MKYVILLSDGMAGRPLPELGQKTTMEFARTPVMDRLAQTAEIGLAAMVPEGMAPGSDTANLSVMGYNPQIYYTGRSPLEALSMGVDMAPTDVSLRCNLVTLSEEEGPYENRTILDHSSDEISTEEAAVLVEALKDGMVHDGYKLFAGISYRHLLIWKEGQVAELTPPHDILTKCIGAYLPENSILKDMMKRSYDILENHPVNVKRRAKGLKPANSAWFWGAGTKPALTSFEEKTGKKGVMISAVDLLRGIAVGAQMDNIIVEGANGGLHTNYEGKADAAVQALTKGGYDFAYVHVEAPDEMGHQGSTEDKITAIEYVDEHVLGRIVQGLDESGEDYRVMVLPDHPTPICVRTHTKEPVPYMIYDSTRAAEGASAYNEAEAQKSGHMWRSGYQLIEHLLKSQTC